MKGKNLFILAGTAATTVCPSVAKAAESGVNHERTSGKPNIVLIMCDDMGYGDLGCYGHPTILTPRIDRMASEGMKMTQYYTGASVSTPSRGALMTGRYPFRTGIYGNKQDVFTEYSTKGMPAEETTMAEVLKSAGYATACIGKWHIGHALEYLPCQNGFDYFYGLPYSNNQFLPGTKLLPVHENNTIIKEYTVDQLSLITEEYTEKAKEFIEKHKSEPFFLYMPQTYPHIPIVPSKKFAGKSKRGRYGDVMMELDWSVGEVLDCLKRNGLDENTVVIFTSDNGGWPVVKQDSGSGGLFYGGKATTWEGGFRVPFIVRWPGTVEPASTSLSMCSALDLLPTFAALAGAELPDVTLDGYDISPIFRDPEAVIRNEYYFYQGSHLYAVREGKWKLHTVITHNPYPKAKRVDEETIRLYNVEVDPSEKFDLSEKRPNIVKRLKAKMDEWSAANPAVPSLIDIDGHVVK